MYESILILCKIYKYTYIWGKLKKFWWNVPRKSFEDCGLEDIGHIIELVR